MWPRNWYSRIEAKLDAILCETRESREKEADFMTDMTQAVADLQAVANALKDEVGVIASEMDALLAALTAATAANDPAAIEAVTAQIRDQVTALQAAGSRDLPPAPAPAPEPTSPPAP
jgi:pimeloyl-ACP methyl ester carboxylesterase